MMSSFHPCPVCANTHVTIIAEIPEMPVFCNVLHATAGEATSAPRGNIRLGFCCRCGHVYNTAFDAGLLDYTPAYENSLHHSAVFNEYAASVARQLIERHNLRHKHVIDIGCGQGDFLKLLCDAGENRGTGFDPSYDPQRSDASESLDISILQDYYSDRYSNLDADLVCCRHVLEHIEEPLDFLRSIADAMRRAGTPLLFIEVPNVLYTIQRLAIWDLIYEHVSYFSRPSLEHAVRTAGFGVLRLAETFGDQYLTVEAELGTGASDPMTAEVRSVERFAEGFSIRYAEKRQEWTDTLSCIRSRNLRTVIWGAGSKGVTILNALRVGAEVDYVVDVNPHKHGRFTAGTGHEIIDPSVLREYRPDVVIVMNDIYLQEIRGMLHGMGLEPTVLSA